MLKRHDAAMSVKKRNWVTAQSITTRTSILVWLAILCPSLLFVLHFSFGGGKGKLVADSYAYRELSLGHIPGVPFNTRLLQPLIASSVASFAALNQVSAFELLTALELLASLVLIAAILRRRGATPQLQAAVLLALGCSLAVTFGYTPVLVDPLALLLVCLTIATLDRGYLTPALVFACLAALTKEYCILLGLVWAYQAYRRGHPRLAIAGAVLPALVLLSAGLALPAGEVFGFRGPYAFVSAMLGYHPALLKFKGPSDYVKTLYMWSWSALWPILLLGIMGLASRPLRRCILARDRDGFIIMLASVPFLLFGDWGRAMLVVVPFGCAVATAHPLARNNRFALLLAAGGLSTALARPFHGATVPPEAFMQIMSLISVSASALLAATIVKSLLRSWPVGAFRIHRPMKESSVKL
jgi:hypothetical protein